MIVEAPATDQSLHVMRIKDHELRAIIDGDNIYAQVTSRYAEIQYPAWNPIDGRFEMWDIELDPDIVSAMNKAWLVISQHPSLQFAA